MALTLFHVNMTSCTFYEYSLHGALQSWCEGEERSRCEGDGRSLDVRVKGGVLV